MSEELVFSVHSDKATSASPLTLAQAGLKEREHLQEWVLAHPQILGPDVMVVTSEFDRWQSKAAAERDRLDILGLGADGRLVVAELKRDAAPDTVEMLAIKYAAMASRFDLEVLSDAHAAFATKHQGKTLTSEQAAEALQAHTNFAVTDETLRAPRIVLIAGSFPSNVTATSVWLSEMGLDVRLVRVQAYQAGSEVIITVSQHYPPPDVEDFLVAPTRASRLRDTTKIPPADWTQDELARLATEVNNQTVLAAMGLCSANPTEWIPSEAIQARTGREPAKHRGDFGGFGVTLRQRFQRSNPPYETQWAVGGTNQAYYRVDPEIAARWQAARPPSEVGETV